MPPALAIFELINSAKNIQVIYQYIGCYRSENNKASGKGTQTWIHQIGNNQKGRRCLFWDDE